jgi:hypothetical protein
MMKKLKQGLKRLLFKNNIRIGKTTEKQKLVEFMSSVKPIKTNHELIRAGGETDGGYLVPNDLDGVEICFSPGVSEVADFEVYLARRGIRCFLADYSVEAPPISNSLFDFEKKYLGPKETDIFMTLENWVERKASNKDDMILQMDIEGAEYGVIFDTGSQTLRRFRILVIEFHSLEHLCDPAGFELINLAFTKILKDFEVVHIHPNNCFAPIQYMDIAIPPLMEFTFLRKDRIANRSHSLCFPHPLDRKCVAEKVDVILPQCWFAQ